MCWSTESFLGIFWDVLSFEFFRHVIFLLEFDLLVHLPNTIKYKRSYRTCVSPRLPSGWLSIDRSVLDLVAHSVGMGKRAEQQSLPSQSQDSQLGPTEEAQTQNSQTQRQAPR